MDGQGDFRWKTPTGKVAQLKFSENSEAFVLEFILVPPDSRGQGIGRLLLERLLLLADDQGKPVQTTARPIGPSTGQTLGRLVAFYRRFGFEPGEQKIAAVAMTRPPRRPERRGP